MLGSRLKDDPKAFARISHSIRSQTSETSWFRVDSTNLDTLARATLPTVAGQMDNFLRWLADQVGDDRLEAVEVGDETDLSGVVGVVEVERLDDLQAHMVAEGLIAYVAEDCLRLTPKGWARIAPPAPTPSEVVAKPPAASTLPQPKIEVCVCPECGGGRRAEVLHSHSEHYDATDDGLVYSITEIDTLRCCGCSTVYVRETKYFSEDEDHERDPRTGEWHTVLVPKVRYWPAATRRKQPHWMGQVEDQLVRQLLDEVYSALDADLRTLAAMGVRAVLDRVFGLGGAPDKGFAPKLQWLTENGVISAAEKDALTVMTDAGSAASHRGWRPEFQDLDTILDAAEALVHRVCVQPEAAQRLKGLVPARPKTAKE